MKVVDSSKYYDILVDEDLPILVYRWKPAILELDEEQYKKGFLEVLKFLDEYKPKVVIHDSRTQVYPITPELQEWIMKNITPRFKEAGVKRVAYVMPKDFISKLALEQLILKLMSFASDLKRMFFEDFDEAMAWVKKGL